MLLVVVESSLLLLESKQYHICMLEIKKLSNNKKALLEKAKNKFILMKTKEVAPKKKHL